MEKREADAVRKAKDAAAADEAQRKGKEERAALRCTRYDPEPPQTTVGTKRKEPEPQTEEQQLEACVNEEAARSEMARNHALSIEAQIAEAERERDRLRDRALPARATDSERAKRAAELEGAEGAVSASYGLADDAWDAAAEATRSRLCARYKLDAVRRGG